MICHHYVRSDLSSLLPFPFHPLHLPVESYLYGQLLKQKTIVEGNKKKGKIGKRLQTLHQRKEMLEEVPFSQREVNIRKEKTVAVLSLFTKEPEANKGQLEEDSSYHGTGSEEREHWRDFEVTVFRIITFLTPRRALEEKRIEIALLRTEHTLREYRLTLPPLDAAGSSKLGERGRTLSPDTLYDNPDVTSLVDDEGRHSEEKLVAEAPVKEHNKIQLQEAHRFIKILKGHLKAKKENNKRLEEKDKDHIERLKAVKDAICNMAKVLIEDAPAVEIPVDLSDPRAPYEMRHNLDDWEIPPVNLKEAFKEIHEYYPKELGRPKVYVEKLREKMPILTAREPWRTETYSNAKNRIDTLGNKIKVVGPHWIGLLYFPSPILQPFLKDIGENSLVYKAG
eukprot:Gb_06423 [translate_table: standard]